MGRQGVSGRRLPASAKGYGAKPSLLGTTRGGNGRQVTYAGDPFTASWTTPSPVRRKAPCGRPSSRADRSCVRQPGKP